MKKNAHIDSNLVKAFKLGDQSAMASLVKRYHLKFCEKAYWLLKDKDQAKDVAQESWTRIINNIHSLKDPEQFKYWAFRIVYNKSMDVLRRSDKTKSDSNYTEYKQTEVPHEEDDKEVLKQHLLKAIKNLPQQQQIVLRLFYNEAYSLKEISELLNISIGTVKSRLFHARESLKKTLKNRTYEN